MEKASFRLVTAAGAKKYMDVMFNPSSYTVDSKASYSTAGGLEVRRDILQFSKVGVRELNLELYFDTVNNNQGDLMQEGANMLMSTQLAGLLDKDSLKNVADVSDKIEDLRKLIDLADEKGTPPLIQFVWGAFVFTGVMVSMRENYTMFLPDGRPVKATVSVTIDEFPLSKAVFPSAGSEAVSKLTNNIGSSQKEDVQKKAEAVIGSLMS